MISTIMPKIAPSACHNTNSKEPRRQFATQTARKKSPKSSFGIRQVRQAQELDADYNDKDLEFDPKTIIACNESVSLELDELCGHNEKTLKEMKLSIEAESINSQPYAQCNPFHHNPSNSQEQYAIFHPPLYEYGNSFDTNLCHSDQDEVPPTTTSTKLGIKVRQLRKHIEKKNNQSTYILVLKFKTFVGNLPSKNILKHLMRQ